MHAYGEQKQKKTANLYTLTPKIVDINYLVLN